MRNYACHRVYIDANHYLKQAFVSIGEDEKIIRLGTFQEEMVATEWIGGVIFLTTTDEAPNGDFHSWAKQQKNGQTPVYAWPLSESDFAREEPTPSRSIRRL